MSASTKNRKAIDAASADPQVMVEGSGWQSRVVSRALDRAAKRSVERGRAFIDAATNLIERSGSENFTVQQVADDAGQSLRTLYQHFKSKDDLLLAVFEEAAERHVAYVRREVDKYDDPLDRLAALIIAAAKGIDPGAPGGTTIALAHYRMKLVVSHPEDLAVVQAPFVGLARELLIDADEAGVITPSNPDHVAYIITTLKSSYLHSIVLGNELGIEMPTPVELAGFCLAGLKADLPAKFDR